MHHAHLWVVGRQFRAALWRGITGGQPALAAAALHAAQGAKVGWAWGGPWWYGHVAAQGAEVGWAWGGPWWYGHMAGPWAGPGWVSQY